MESTMIAARAVRCPKCRKELPGSGESAGSEREVCPSCRSSLFVRRFATLALPEEARIDRAETAMTGEAVCFFHPEKKAALSCEQCGRFICSLCDLPMGSRHLCPSCVEGGLVSERVPELVHRRFVWGGASLALGLLPLLFGNFLFLTYFALGPAAIFTGIYSFRKPGSLVRGRRPIAAIFGIVGGLLQLAIVVAFFYYFINR